MHRLAHLQDTFLRLLAGMQGAALQHIRALLEQGTQRRQNGRLLGLQMKGHLQCMQCRKWLTAQHSTAVAQTLMAESVMTSFWVTPSL